MIKFLRKITPRFFIGSYHYILALIGAVFFFFPSEKLKVIGITGTSGKSTTVEMLAKILNDAGFKTASLSSIKFRVGEKEETNKLKMTMPGRFKIQSFLKKAVKENCRYAVIEVTSQGIEQFRHKFITFEAAVFTNLSPEHIESHGGFENYRRAKAKLFRSVKNIHVIKRDDPCSDYFWQIPAKIKIGYGLAEENGILPKTELSGHFNQYNMLAAAKTAIAFGVDSETCQKSLENFKTIPGRMEIITENPFTVVIDYAHTPEQLKQVYSSFKDKNKICVLGSCGGGRDKWKRPEIGKIAKEFCQKIIITNEDPYDEDPMEIIRQVAEGTEGKAQIILDRKEAIKKALEMATPGDAVIITGKGSECWMCVENGKKIPWDDREIAKEELLSKRL
ncbi:MAG: UDP-N-acetylmuramoyl-L-alanyl-D-glutamate--2,6-diaminopimelate ligase [bacterium]|nr:UDP-N-acetylmuramoyl-L-alanyl-D-glutamate--2,6-diaminopimelate ligase [bacterium]